jgi:hypothetical protein
VTDIANRSFAPGEEVETDGHAFADCAFQQAVLVYRGGDHPRFDRCTFHSCGWEFRGAALKTVQFLQQINASPGGQAFLGEIFAPGAYLQE